MEIAVVYQCALVEDFGSFADGDETEVGEKVRRLAALCRAMLTFMLPRVSHSGDCSSCYFIDYIDKLPLNECSGGQKVFLPGF